MIVDIIMWSLIVIMIPLLGWAIDEDHWFWGIVFTLVASWGLGKWQGFSVWAAVTADWRITLQYALLYIGIGLVWSLLKFYFRARKLKAESLKKDDNSIHDTYQDSFDKLFSNVPVWIAFWFYLLIWDALSDYLKSFFEWIADTNKWLFTKVFEMATKETIAKAKR